MRMDQRQLTQVAVNYVEADGSSPPIVFLHGATDASTSYLPSIAMLGGVFRGLAMDFRGHGGSGHVEGRYRICDHAEDVREMLRDVVGAPSVIVGHSLGALVAIRIAAEHPKLIRGVFLEDPPLYSAQMPAFHDAPEYGIFLGLREVLRQHHAMDQTADELALLVGSWPIHPMLFEGRSLLEVAGPDVVRARAEGLHRLDVGVPDAMLDGSQFDGFDPDAALAKIACPVHVLAGAVHLGGTITARDVERLASTIRHCTHRSLSGVGHLIHHTAVDVYVGEVRAFAEACR